MIAMFSDTGDESDMEDEKLYNDAKPEIDEEDDLIKALNAARILLLT